MRSDAVKLHSKLGDMIEESERREKILREALEDIMNLRDGPEYIALAGTILEGSFDDEWEVLLDVGIDRAKKALEEAPPV